MDKDNRFLVHAIYQLFIRQAETDERFRDVFLRDTETNARLNEVRVSQSEMNGRLHEISKQQVKMEGQLRKVVRYQKVQKVTSLVNAIVGYIPVGGAILTNVFSGGASILNDLQVCGLVESVLGIAKDASGGFGGECLVDRFVERSNDVLSKEEWAKVPPEKKKVVEEAASDLRLTIDELRDKLLFIAAIQSGEIPSEEVIVEEDDWNEQSSCDMSTIEPAIPAQKNSRSIASLAVEEEEPGGVDSPAKEAATAEVPEIEDVLKLWEQRGVSKDAVAPLKSQEVATCVAAFLVNYEAELSHQFKTLTDGLGANFRGKFIFGRSFTDVDEKDKEIMLEEVASTLEDVTKEKLSPSMRIRLKQFVRFAGQ